MWDRLNKIEKHYEELNRQIAKPEIATDLKKVQALAQERAGIEDLVTTYRQYKATTKQLEETKGLLYTRPRP